MITLTVRTDKAEAEVGVFSGTDQLAYKTWTAHRQLAVTLNAKIEEVLVASGKTLNQIEGIICFEGPGSFTGLRIGLSVANTLAYGLNVPIIAAGEDTWIAKGIKQLQAGKSDKIALPKYSAPAATTAPKK